MNTEQAHIDAPTDDFVASIDIHELLPQQEPFVMISRLEHFDMRRVVTSTDIHPDNLFVDDGVMSASGIIENMAQTCAARIGYINKYVLRKGIQIGFIGAISNFSIVKLPEAGRRIITEVEIAEEVFGMILAHATVTCDGEPIACTDLKIAIKD